MEDLIKTLNIKSITKGKGMVLITGKKDETINNEDWNNKRLYLSAKFALAENIYKENYNKLWDKLTLKQAQKNMGKKVLEYIVPKKHQKLLEELKRSLLKMIEISKEHDNFLNTKPKNFDDWYKNQG